MSETRDGQVVTFYSYKGGTGRSMALANVAWILAANGRRVLVADWDLESPGLHRFFKPFLDEEQLIGAPGVIDMIREYEDQAIRGGDGPAEWYEQYARVTQLAFSIDWHFPNGGTLDFLSAGRQNNDYATTVGALDWETFYDRLSGAKFLDALRAGMKSSYDYVLIDSRTGLSDVADICTLHLPDVLVDCFTLSDQGIEGAARVARKVAAQRSRSRRRRVLPVPMRVDPAEKEKADAGRTLARLRFADLPTGMSDQERQKYWSEVEVPYRAFYAYEETLAVFGDQPQLRSSLLSAYELIASYVTEGAVSGLPAMEEPVRLREKARFERRLPELAEERIVLRYAPPDQVWAEWIERLLVSAGVRVRDAREDEEAATNKPARFRTLAIVSGAYVAAADEPSMTLAGGEAPVAVYVADVRPLPEFAPGRSVSVAGKPASVAAERILRALGWSRATGMAGTQDNGVRYPGTEPAVFGAPARNARFTGREEELRQLRRELRSGGRAVVLQQNAGASLPVALHGMGGVGKTQLALEYAHRFRTAYDVVWWIQADPPQFIDTTLADLAPLINVSAESTAVETAHSVLQALRSGAAARRWLIIYDNAEEPDLVGPLIPSSGAGHVLITSRNAAWSDRSYPVPIDVFRRHESITHLRQRIETITDREADDIAEALGDLPIAVAAAGAWLAETGEAPAAYLGMVQEAGPSAVQKTWDLSLDRLAQQSPVAVRLLQLLSVMAPDIALDLLTSDEMAAALATIDPSMLERVVRGAPIQEMNRLALIRHDRHARQVQVHRLLQAVVRARMSEDELYETRHQVHQILARSRPRREVDDRDTWAHYRQIWPHLEVSGAVNCEDESVRQLLIDRVRYLFLAGDLAQGEQLATRIIETWRERLVEGDIPAGGALLRQTLHLRFNLANILRAQGRFTTAYEIDEATLAEQTTLLGDRHPHTLMTAGGLAADLRALGRYAEALPRDQATHQAWQQVLGEDSPRTLTAASNLAVSYRAVGDFHSAHGLDEHVYNRRRLVLGPDHPQTLNSATGVGRDLREAGEYDRSVSILQEVFRIYQDRYNADDADTIIAQVNLAVSMRSAGRSDEASPMLDDAYRRAVERFGPTAPVALVSQLSRAVNMLVLRDIERGGAEMEAVITAYRDQLGPAHPHTLVCLSNLSVASSLAGDSGRALSQAESAYSQFAEALGKSHPYTMAAAMNATTYLIDSGQPAEAAAWMREIADLMTATLGPNHPDTICCRAHIVLADGRLDDREVSTAAAPVIRQLGEVIGMAHPLVRLLEAGRFIQRILDPNPY